MQHEEQPNQNKDRDNSCTHNLPLPLPLPSHSLSLTHSLFPTLSAKLSLSALVCKFERSTHFMVISKAYKHNFAAELSDFVPRSLLPPLHCLLRSIYDCVCVCVLRNLIRCKNYTDNEIPVALA